MLIKDILFPKTCLSCGSLGSYICLNCQRKLIYVNHDLCLYCGRPSLYGLTHPICRRKNQVDGLISVFHYNNTLKKAIKNIKYRLVREALRELLLIINPEILQSKLAFIKNKDVMINPIPLHARRLKSRGFNQSELIACFLAQFLKAPVTQSLIRSKDTKSQAMLKKGYDRFLNIKKAFIATSAVFYGKPILLVDDLVTSGATVKEAALTLKRRGAFKVYILALARG